MDPLKVDPIDIHELRDQGPRGKVEELRLEIFEAVNKLRLWTLVHRPAPLDVFYIYKAFY